LLVSVCGSLCQATARVRRTVTALGVILLFAGIELAVGLNGEAFSRSARTVLVVTAGVALWNMGVAYVAGLLRL
jgi:hypothetical protein